MQNPTMRDATPADITVGRRVFSPYLAPTPTPASIGTITRLRDDGWHEMTTDAGGVRSFDVTRLAVWRDEHRDEEVTAYHEAMNAALETVEPRPLGAYANRADAATYHSYGDTPADAAELWAAHMLRTAAGEEVPAGSPMWALIDWRNGWEMDR